MIKLATYDGVKARLEDFPKEAWEQVIGSEDKNEVLVAIVKKCMNFRVNTISTIPWKITDLQGETITDSSKMLPPELSWLKPLLKNIRRMETSLIYNSESFYSITENRLLDPRTVKPKWDQDMGITHFERKIKGREINIDPEEIIYIPLLDISETEPTFSIMDVVEIDSSVLRSIDEYIIQYFNGGTIKATIITSKDSAYPTKDEIAKVENFLNRTLKGLSNAFKSVFLRTPIDATVVGSGLEDFDPDLLNAKIMDVITAFEVPPSAVLPSAANYATAISDKRLFYESVGVDRINLIFDSINEQYLDYNGINIVSEHEKLSVFQTDEHERSQSLMNLVNAGFSTLDAANILGYDIDDDVKERLINSETDLIDRLSNMGNGSQFVFGNDNQESNKENTEIIDNAQKTFSIY